MAAPRLDPSVTVGKTKRRVITMTDEMWEEVMMLAAIRRVSASYVIREFAEAGLAGAKSEGELRAPKAKRAARKVTAA